MTPAETQTGRVAPYKIAVLLPCYNEAASAKVVGDFRAALPDATVFVFHNNSPDDTVAVARDAVAEVFQVKHQGKGFAVRRMFTDVEADIYVLADGDATYYAASAPRMIARLLANRFDMVVATRVGSEKAAHRAGHRTGKIKLLTALVATVFGPTINDMLSSYRVFSRRFVKSLPVLSGGFEIETELTVHALELGLAVEEIGTPYYARPEGPASKLNTWRDGFLILRTIVELYRTERPMGFFGGIGIVLAIASIGFVIPIFITYAKTGLVPRFPTAILSTGLMLIARTGRPDRRVSGRRASPARPG